MQAHRLLGGGRLSPGLLYAQNGSVKSITASETPVQGCWILAVPCRSAGDAASATKISRQEQQGKASMQNHFSVYSIYISVDQLFKDR